MLRRCAPLTFSTANGSEAHFRLKPLAAACLMALSGGALAGPEGADVVGGAGSIARNGITTTINQHSDRMAINWQSYNVGADERVRYIQPSSSSVSLNRILSNRGSQIHGQIDANGHVILVNPNGLIFGENAVINAGGVLASGLAIDPDAFMNGEMVFRGLDGSAGTVVNSGVINAAT